MRDGLLDVRGWARRLSRRHLWIAPGIALGLVASQQSEVHGIGLIPLLLFSIVPHAPVLLGYAQPRASGRMPARAVPLFNALHEPAFPVAVLVAAATGLLSPFWTVASLAWLGHIVVDWGLGQGLRDAHGLRIGRSFLTGRHPDRRMGAVR
jgi:hypothetical protein